MHLFTILKGRKKWLRRHQPIQLVISIRDLHVLTEAHQRCSVWTWSREPHPDKWVQCSRNSFGNLDLAPVSSGSTFHQWNVLPFLNLWSWAGANQVSGLVESLPKLGSCHRRFVFLQRKLDSLLWAFPSGFCFWVLRPFSHLFPALFQVAWYLFGSMGTSSESNSINEVRRTDGTARSKYICPWKCKPRDICPRTGVAFLAAFAHGVLGFNVLLNI